MSKAPATLKAAASKSPAPPRHPPAWQWLGTQPSVLALALALATLLVFARAVRCGFVDYDDADYVTANAQVQAGLTWAGVQWAFTTGHASNWHPLTWLSHMLDAQLYGLAPAGHHLTSVVLHAVNASLVFLVLTILTGAKWRSLIVATLFALHPLRVESVAWISERKDVLSMFFGLLAILAYGRYARKSEGRNPKSETTPKPESRMAAGWRTYVAALLLFALSLMSKPMFVTLPCVLLLLDWWPLGRSAESQARSMNVPRETLMGQGVPAWRIWAWLVLEKLPFFALAIGSSVVTFLVQRKGGAVASVAGLPLGLRIENAFVSYVRYLVKTVWPADLATLYPHPGHWPVWQVLGAVTLLVGVTVFLIVRRRAWPFALVGWLWFAGTLVPVIGLVQVGIQSMADRYTYLPSVGLLLAVVWSGHAAVARLRMRPAQAAVAVVCVGVACAGLTWRQIGFWRNSETLFRRAVAVTKDNYLAHNNLGFYLANQGRHAEAIAEYERSLQIKRDYLDALNNLGRSLAEQGRFAEALPLLEAALRSNPRHVEVLNNYANALSSVGRLEEACTRYEAALREKPDHADAHSNYGAALAMLGRLDEALFHMRESVRLRPAHAGSRSNLGNVLAMAKRLDEALIEFRAALQLKPDDAHAHNNLGNALAEKGQLDEAADHYRQALQLNTNNPEANYNLGAVLLRQGQREAAARHLREAVRLKPDYTDAKNQLRNLGLPETP